MSETILTSERPNSAAKKTKRRSRSVDEWRVALEVEVKLSRLLSDIHRLISKDFASRTRDLGLTRLQWRVLFTLNRVKEGVSQTELADITETEKAPLGKILDRLEEGGWVVRKNHPTDRRTRLVYATSKIERHADRLAEAAKATFAQMLQGVRQKDVKELIARLEKLKRNLGGAEV